MKTDWKFEIHDAVWFEDKIGRVEDKAVDSKGREVYLIQFTNHRYRWLPVENLEVYIG